MSKVHPLRWFVVAEQYDRRAPMPPQGRHPHGTSLMPMQALGAPPPDLHSGPLPAQQHPARQGPQQPPRGRSKAMDYTLKGLGLFGVALVSGILWFLTHNEAPVATQNSGQQTQHTGKYSFTPYVAAQTVGECASHATNRVQSFLQSHPCQSLTRSLWTTQLPDGNKVLASVAVMKMGSAADAAQIDKIGEESNSGHVQDMVEEGYPVPNGPKNLENGGYKSDSDGLYEVIVVAEFATGTEDAGLSHNQPAKAELNAVCQDALNQKLAR